MSLQLPSSRWGRVESRIVRPFKYAKDYLNDTTISLVADGPFSIDEIIYAEDLDAQTLHPKINIPAAPADFGVQVGISDTFLRLLVVQEDASLKQAKVIRNFRLQDLPTDPMELETVEQPNPQLDLRIHVAVVVGSELPVVPGLAHRKGSWLARKTFRVRPRQSTVDFPIEPRSPEWFRKERDLPSQTSFLVEASDDLDQLEVDVQSAVRVYMNDQLYANLGRGQNSPSGKALSAAIFCDILADVLEQQKEFLETANEGSVVDRLLSKLSRSSNVPKFQIAERFKTASSSEIRAFLHQEIKMNQAFISSLVRG